MPCFCVILHQLSGKSNPYPWFRAVTMRDFGSGGLTGGKQDAMILPDYKKKGEKRYVEDGLCDNQAKLCSFWADSGGGLTPHR
jgi:hypothetical protein